MSQWLANAPPIVSYLIGIIPFIAGAILLLGALLYRPQKDRKINRAPVHARPARNHSPAL
jgi:hypothetical protein